MKPAESRTCVDASGYVCQVRVSEWPSILLRVSSGCFTCRGAFHADDSSRGGRAGRTALDQHPCACRRGVVRPRHTRRYELRLSHLCAMPGKHSWDWRILRSQPGFSHPWLSNVQPRRAATSAPLAILGMGGPRSRLSKNFFLEVPANLPLIAQGNSDERVRHMAEGLFRC